MDEQGHKGESRYSNPIVKESDSAFAVELDGILQLDKYYSCIKWKAEGIHFIYLLFMCCCIMVASQPLSWIETVKPYVVRSRDWSIHQTFMMKCK